MPTNTMTPNVTIEAARASMTALVNKLCDDLAAQFESPQAPERKIIDYKFPTIEDGHDPRNKNGHNLTPRGVEILYRVFDDGGGYNRASKMLNITQAAAKNRKGSWVKAGGKQRERLLLDIDSVR